MLYSKMLQRKISKGENLQSLPAVTAFKLIESARRFAVWAQSTYMQSGFSSVYRAMWVCGLAASFIARYRSVAVCTALDWMSPDLLAISVSGDRMFFVKSNSYQDDCQGCKKPFKLNSCFIIKCWCSLKTKQKSIFYLCNMSISSSRGVCFMVWFVCVPVTCKPFLSRNLDLGFYKCCL